MGFVAMDQVRSERAVNYLFQAELDQLRKMAEAGSELAPAAALFFCHTYAVDVPKWLVSFAACGYCKLLSSNRPRKRGRSSGPLERYRQDMIDYMRWDTVISTREQQEVALERVLTIKHFPGETHSRFANDLRKMQVWLGRDWLRALECSSMMLRETPAFGGPDAVKASYYRVKNCFEYSKSSAWRYFLFHPEFLESIGIEHPSRWLPSRKFTPLYDLTL
ncbi:MAG: hypothetical protein Q7W56_12310 [Candidatus Latescibacteria bacterium]|nr:hypothetical protein [Candidatus Latescibacterota bacterium]